LAFKCNNIKSGGKWYAEGEQVRTVDSMIDWLRELVKLRDVFMADPATAQLLTA
jgi:hypothetical protein